MATTTRKAPWHEACSRPPQHMPIDEYATQVDTRFQSTQSAAEAVDARAKRHDEPSLGEPPEESSAAQLGKRYTVAAGIPAVVQTMKFGLGEMGVTRSLRSFLAVNQENGFDCQSCAWPSPDTGRKIAEFCENGAKAIADELTRRRIGPECFERFSIPELLKQSDYWLNAQGRLTYPMIRREGSTHYQPTEWAAAFPQIGSELPALARPDEAIFYTSGKTCNEAAFLFQLFVRQLGTNNLPDCSNMRHEASGTALTETIGLG